VAGERILGAYVLGYEPGSADYFCLSCRTSTAFSAVPGDGDGVVPGVECECGGYARLRLVCFSEGL